ncbi:CobW family GTP-binding protein [Hoyosella altamirensis]|uniref:G3E family GTPase n=1 Tax=Hoyosella altamirensis TaxID=616997 RepID=A0A839RIZ2_9ACTN|nr:GTP-binding protein [Hoyosella altamirensis]MBB3036144.1 G3E family GTPase [Hoyosella altamirensis]
MSRKSIPVLVIAGFLGSGKTTLLNYLLRHNRGTRIGVMVNDFGAINIDALLVAGQVDVMVSLSNGCICCEVDTGDITDMLGKLANAKPSVDVIAVEASGVAEPGALARLVLSADDPRFHFAGLVLVVDAEASAHEQHPELAQHVRVADLVLLNKSDRIAADQRAELRNQIALPNPKAPVVDTAFCRVDPELLFDPVSRPRRSRQAEQLSFDQLLEQDDHHHHHHPPYQSVAWSSGRPLHPRRFVSFLEERPPGLYRAKGVLDLGDYGDGSRLVLQLVGRSLRVERGTWGTAERPNTRLVFIGLDIDEAALAAGLNACVVTDDDGPDEYAALSVLRYVQNDDTFHDEVIFQ